MRPIDVDVSPNAPIVTYGLPASMARLVITLNGDEYQMYFAEDQTDRRTGYRHVIMSVLNHDNATARFTVAVGGEVYGVLRTPTATFVFEPNQRGESLIYRYDPASVLEDRRRGIIGSSLLAKRHHQIELVSHVRADYSFSDEVGAFVVGGDLGSSEVANAAGFVRAAQRLTSLTNFTGQERFELASSRPSASGGKIVAFRQIVEGLPVDALNEIVVDKNGRIVRIATTRVPESVQKRKLLITARDAEERLRAQWKAFANGTAFPAGIRLRASYSFDRESNTLHPIYAVTFDAETRVHAKVDGVSGAVEIIELTQQAVDYHSCRDMTFAHYYVTDCDSTANHAYSIKQTGYPPGQLLDGYCDFPNQTLEFEGETYPIIGCDFPGAQVAHDVTTDIRQYFPAAMATNAPGSPACCDEITDVDIVQNSRRPYSYFPASSHADGKRVYIRQQDDNSYETHAHELAHVYINVYNEPLHIPLSPGSGPSTFQKAVSEGIADTVAGLLGALSGRPGYGQTWVYGDGPNASGAVNRSASNPNFQYWQDIVWNQGGHNGGQVIYRYFRRLQERTGISSLRLLGIVLGTAASIRDAEGNGFDAGDFRRAVYSTIKSGETDLKNAVELTYAELYRADATAPGGVTPLPPGDPGPAGAPPITPAHWANFSYCGIYNGFPVSVFTAYWTPTPNTNRYIGWVQTADDVTPRYSAEVSAGATSMHLVTNTSVEGRISSCNGFGCSGMSNAVYATHQCGGW